LIGAFFVPSKDLHQRLRTGLIFIYWLLWRTTLEQMSPIFPELSSLGL
jgi:hypothetical protein